MSDANDMFDHILESIRSTPRQYQIMFDAMNFDYSGAYRDYADAIDKSVEELSSIEKQQAVLNHVLKDSDDTRTT